MFLSPKDSAGQFRILRRMPEIMPKSHWHMHLEAVYCSAGSAEYEIGTEYQRLRARQLLMFWAAIPHRVSSSEPGSEVFVINAPVEALMAWAPSREFVAHLISGKPVVAKAQSRFDAATFGCWHDDLNSDHHAHRDIAKREIACLVQRVGIEFLQQDRRSYGRRTEKNSKAQELLRRVIEYINEQDNQGVTVSDVAEALGYNRRYLTTRFRELSGVSLHTYIRHIRVSRARALLATSNLSIEEVAWKAGFRSTRQFYEAIRSEFDQTPRQLRAALSNPLLEGGLLH
ncbi:MAG: helix-turn-helix domain-containing protein [Pelagimonas sp.]|jgi:AraC-like DNA-binding protein|nr:helix-turn-helix domain-containing protein [Pelagimonas sp.]